MSELAAQLAKNHEDLKLDLIKLIENEMESMKSAMNFNNQNFEEFKLEVAAVKSDNIEIRKENSRLSKELKDVKQELTALAQYSRSCNLEIKGIPIKAGENLGTTMQTISTCLNVEIKDSVIDVIHRVPTKNNSTAPNIIVKLASRNIRDQILKKAKKQRINTSHLGFACEVSPIFINEHLCICAKQIKFFWGLH